MTLNLNGNAWAKPALIVGGLLLTIGLWAYLAGGIFLVSQARKFDDATPLTLYQYWYYYGEHKAVQKWLYISGGLSLAALLAPFLFFFAPAKRSLFGDARFASASEVKKAGLFGEKGIIVGRMGNWFSGYRYLMFPGSQHAIISAPTRSGKGVGIVIPNLLNWPDSIVVLDIKQENWDITSGYRRKHGQACFLFNPAAVDYRTHRYNPLAYVSEDPNFRIDDVQKIANMLFPDQPGTDVIWTATPRALFLGVVLYLIETPGKLVTLGQVLRESLADGDGSKYFAGIINMRALGARIRQTADDAATRQAASDLDAVLADKGKAPEHHPRMAEMAVWFDQCPAYSKALRERIEALKAKDAKTPDVPAILAAMEYDRASVGVGQALSGACVRALNSYISIASDNTRAGVMTSFRSRLELWNNPLVDAATSANDFDLRDVRKKRMSIYLGVTPDNLERMAPLLNLFFQQLIDLNTRELPQQNKAIKYTCMLLMDEFTAIGKIPILSKGISYIAGYWLRMMPIIQSPAQVVEVYGKDAAQTFTTNHALQIIYPPKASETQTAKDISEWLGYQTVKGKSESKGKGVFSKKSQSESLSDQRRALLLPQEITGLKKGKEIVVMEDVPPILGKKVMYFQDHAFVDRLKSVSKSLAALGKKIPKQSQLEAAAMNGELGAPVPHIDLEAHHQLVGGDAPTTVTLPSAGGTKTITVERPVTADDMPQLAMLSLEAFAVDFSKIDKPQAGALDEQALLAYADDLCRQAGINV
ncbi:type IV secretory system conjugative DNA transfer family protein [Burkholderia diffusa]|uniref:type IV secretory system conjugative DNA transfer family protein n=1 Tax=Burkholderia diffusa TaxID=488732 RepID=UPI0018C51B48|nr:type IV secretory system conjugative DNA transfer family protein [Burkholderia diffusa]